MIWMLFTLAFGGFVQIMRRETYRVFGKNKILVLIEGIGCILFFGGLVYFSCSLICDPHNPTNGYKVEV